MKDTKLFIGPMTKNVVDAIIEYCNDYDHIIGLIPSRRQVDCDGGYVGWNTKEFLDYVREKTDRIIIERDHSGIGQGVVLDDGTISQEDDALNNIDIIHIDPWKIYPKYKSGLYETINCIKYINSINDKCLFEVGTEESIRKFECYEFEKLLNDLQSKLGKLFNKIEYAVVQSGTKLIETRNVGVQDLDRLKKMTDICKKYGVLSKEHNGDYLSKEEIKQKFNCGLDAINIAPEYGVFETKIILQYTDPKLIEEIFDICYKSKTWKKWVNEDFDPLENKIKLIEICGHYVNRKIKEITNVDDNIIKKEIIKKLIKDNEGI